jgi:hypothetical protein
MTLDASCEILSIQWYTNMESEAERNLKWRIGQGCCGQACLKGHPTSEDLTRYQTQTYEELLGGDGQTPWGLTKDQWTLTRHLGSVLSVPIPVPGQSTRILGVLNIDSQLPLVESRLHEKDVLDWLTEKHTPEIGLHMLTAGIQKKRSVSPLAR